MEKTFRHILFSDIRNEACFVMSDGTEMKITMSRDEFDRLMDGDIYMNVSNLFNNEIYNSWKGRIREELSPEHDV